MLVTSGIEAWNHPVLGTYNGSEPQSCWRERELGIVSPDNGNLICAASISDGLWPRTTFLGQPSLSFGQKSQPFHLFSMVFGENPISPMLSLVFPWFFYGFPMVFPWFSLLWIPKIPIFLVAEDVLGLPRNASEEEIRKMPGGPGSRCRLCQ